MKAPSCISGRIGHKPYSAYEAPEIESCTLAARKHSQRQLRMLHERLLEVHEIEIGNRPGKTLNPKP